MINNDKLNKLYISKDWNDIYKFYKLFNNKKEIITWMKNRKKMIPTIIHFNEEANNYAIVVIPTINSDGKWAKIDRKIFRNLHIIFAENQNKQPNEYFNYAKSVNDGIKEALKLNPKWIIISNDDICKIDKIDRLIEELKQSEQYDTLFFPKSNIYSDKTFLAKAQLQRLIRPYSEWGESFSKIYRMFKVHYETLDFRDRYLLYRLFYKPILKIPHHQGNFIVLNSKLIRRINSKIFDETFINGLEDTYLSYKYLSNSKYKLSNFNIRAITGGSLGTGLDRVFRGITNEIYLENVISVHLKH